MRALIHLLYARASSNENDEYFFPEMAIDSDAEPDPTATTERTGRQLQSYHIFSCALQEANTLKLGFLVDEAYLDKASGSREQARQQVTESVARWSRPYELQFNIQLVVDELLFHDDEAVTSFGTSWMICGNIRDSIANTIKQFSAFRNAKRALKSAAWIFITACAEEQSANIAIGVAWTGTIGMRAAAFAEDTVASAAVVYRGYDFAAMHEIGHLMGAYHVFDDRHNREKASGLGIMDYGQNRPPYFEAMHDEEMCKVVRAISSHGYHYLPLKEIWGTPAMFDQRNLTLIVGVAILLIMCCCSTLMIALVCVRYMKRRRNKKQLSKSASVRFPTEIRA